MDTQTIVNLARKRAYTDSTQVSDSDAILYLNLVYKDIRQRISQKNNLDYAADIFGGSLIVGQTEYSIPIITGSQHGADKILDVVVDYMINGVSSPIRAFSERFSNLDYPPEYYQTNQSFRNPFYCIYDTGLFIYPTPTTTSYVFTVSGIVAQPQPGDTYTTGGNTYTIVTTSITSGSGTITSTGTGTPSASGTLTRSLGQGDTTIAYSSYTTSSGTFQIYASTIDIDLVISSDTTQIKGIPEYSHHVLSTGLVRYFFEARGQLDMSTQWYGVFEKECDQLQEYISLRQSAPFIRQNPSLWFLQSGAGTTLNNDPFSA